MNKTLFVDAKTFNSGINIRLLNHNYKITYPKKIWANLPNNFKKTFLDNLAYASTNFLPLMLKKNKISYNTNPPILENLLYKNVLLDLLNCERGDQKPHLAYLKNFYNLEFIFASQESSLLKNIDWQKIKTDEKKVVVPFTFGKESLATVALCQEIGLEPILVYCQEPSQPYEEKYKLKALKKFSQEFNLTYYFLKNEPGAFRYGKAFNFKKPTEIGWGTQTTNLALMMLPFARYHQAKYILFGNEYSNNEFNWKNGWKEWLSYDQTNENIINQDNMIRLLSNDQVKIRSTLQPLEEINIFFLLHHRYPEYGKYQFSCIAEDPLLKNSQWCHKCYKCALMFLFAECCKIDYQKIGFQKNLLHLPKMFDHYFGQKFAAGSNKELDFSFYILHKRQHQSNYLKKFKKEKLPQTKTWAHYLKYYTSKKPYTNLPKKFENKVLKIFTEELNNFKNVISK